MSRIVKIKNSTAGGITACGKSIGPGLYISLSLREADQWSNDPEVFTLVGNGTLVVNKGTDTVDDIADPIAGWQWLIGDTLPTSRTISGKLAVHSSSKPEPSGAETYVVWSGSGDDLESPSDVNIGAGDLLAFNITYGNATVSKDVRFDPAHGRVWIHEAYIKFQNGGVPDYVTADIMAPATLVQNVANLDLVLDGEWAKYSPGGPGTGTHGFAANPSLVPRSFAKDGDWDYDGTNLTPNFTGTGGYKISTNERAVHRYVNKIPCFGSSSSYVTMTSDETAELIVSAGYFIRITAYNVSNSNWNASIFMEIYRERTVS